MGYYACTCSNCGGPAIFFSFSMSIECSNCRRRYEFVSLLAIRTMRMADDDAQMLSTCTSIDIHLLEPVELSLPEAAIEKIADLIAENREPGPRLREAAERFVKRSS